MMFQHMHQVKNDDILAYDDNATSKLRRFVRIILLRSFVGCFGMAKSCEPILVDTRLPSRKVSCGSRACNILVEVHCEYLQSIRLFEGVTKRRR